MHLVRRHDPCVSGTEMPPGSPTAPPPRDRRPRGLRTVHGSDIAAGSEVVRSSAESSLPSPRLEGRTRDGRVTRRRLPGSSSHRDGKETVLKCRDLAVSHFSLAQHIPSRRISLKGRFRGAGNTQHDRNIFSQWNWGAGCSHATAAASVEENWHRGTF